MTPKVDWGALAAELADVSGLQTVQRERPIGPHTTYRVGGAARVGVTLATSDATTLHELAAALRRAGVPLLVVGKGSNLLVADEGFNGVALWLGEHFEDVHIAQPEADTARRSVTAGGAANLPVVARRCAAAGAAGFEWAVGVPGSVGGAVCMNAGGHGSDMAAHLTSALVADLHSGSTRSWLLRDLALGYRRSALGAQHLVLQACLQLSQGDPKASADRIADIVAWRREHQPGGQNAGSVFMNPPGDSAGRIVDAAGLRGHRLGSATVSQKHANFFIAEEGGTAADVFALMCEAAERVYAHSGVTLTPETRLVGFGTTPWGCSS